MDADRSLLAKIRTRISRTPSALAPYDAFADLVKEKLVTWPKLSADRAAGFIMSVWTAEAAKSGRIKIPRSDLNWIVGAGKLCRWRLKGAEKAWARELGAHLLRISVTAEPGHGPRGQEAAAN